MQDLFLNGCPDTSSVLLEQCLSPGRGGFTDLVLVCDDGRLAGHRAVLASCVPWLRETPDAETAVLPGVAADSLGQALRELYLGGESKAAMVYLNGMGAQGGDDDLLGDDGHNEGTGKFLYQLKEESKDEEEESEYPVANEDDEEFLLKNDDDAFSSQQQERSSGLFSYNKKATKNSCKFCPMKLRTNGSQERHVYRG